MDSGYRVEDFGKHWYAAGLAGGDMDICKDRCKDFGHHCKSDTHQSRNVQKDLVDYSNSGKGKPYSMDG